MKKTQTPRTSGKKLPSFISRQVGTSQRYFLDLLPNRSQSLAVACGGYEHVRKDYVISRNDFPYFCIEFVCAGKGKVWFGESAAAGQAQESLPIQAGTLFVYGPGMPHRIETDTRRLLRKHYVDFVGRQAGARLRRMGLTAGSVMRVSHPDEISEILNKLEDKDVDLASSIYDYQRLILLNKHIDLLFKKRVKEISLIRKEREKSDKK